MSSATKESQPEGRLSFLCAGCGARLNVESRRAGRRSKCPRCGQTVLVPAPSTPDISTQIIQSGMTPTAGPSKTPGNGLPLPQLPGYEVLRKVGQGGMAAVFAARQENLDRIVAIKTILVDHQPQTVGRFEKEARTVAKLQHPNIVAAYDFGRHQGRLYLVMELLEGDTLEAFVAREGPQSEAVTWNLVRQVAAGLAHADQFGIVHRDIKPANLFLVDAPTGFALPAGASLVKITDFGLALLAERAEGHSRLTQAGFALGTPSYMAPEQFNRSDVDCRADIYALGATAYYALHGVPPYTQDTFWQIMVEKNAGRQPRIAPTLSARSRDLLLAMMDSDPGRRPANYAELIERIDKLCTTQEAAKTSTSSEPSNSTFALPASSFDIRIWARKKRWLVLGAAGLLLVVLWLAVVFFPRHTPLAANQYVTSGWVQALFDGATLRGWAIREGGWMVARDSEGGQVLSGQGIISRQLPPLANYRLTVGIDLAKASAVELQFGMAPPNSSGQPRTVFRISPEGIIAGQRNSDHGELQPQIVRQPFPSGRSSQSTYIEARIEREETSWAVYFDGQLIGRLPVQPETDLMELRQVAEGGAAFFDAPEAAELTAAPR
jgi:serine/threonine protein kinase/DNA-directed RNA polymerase subunit RPC12/RpoP